MGVTYEMPDYAFLVWNRTASSRGM